MSYRQDSELNDIIEGFQMLASDNEGLVNPNELKEIMETMNMHEKNPFLYNIILNLCSDQETLQKGGIEAGDFISLLDQELNDTSSNDGLQKIFSVFSNPNTNTIPLSVISQIVREDASEDELKLKSLISKPEINGKELTFNEFNEIIKTETPKQSSHEHIIYKKKPSSRGSKEKYFSSKNIKNNDENNNVEINFNNNIINNNSPLNSINPQDSLGSNEKNSDIYSFANKRSPNINEGYDFDYNNNNKNTDEEKTLSNQNNENNINYQINNNIDNNINNIINNNDNQNNNIEEDKKMKKKYRHMRSTKNNEDEIKDNINNNEVKKATNISYRMDNKFTKGRYENVDSYKNNINDEENENDDEKNDIKEKRYHRRYRETKISEKKEEITNMKKETNNEDNNKVYLRYRKKNEYS